METDGGLGGDGDLGSTLAVGLLGVLLDVEEFRLDDLGGEASEPEESDEGGLDVPRFQVGQLAVALATLGDARCVERRGERLQLQVSREARRLDGPGPVGALLTHLVSTLPWPC